MIRVGVIGAGQFGREHARVYAQSANAQLVSVCDLNEAGGKRVAEQFNAAFCTDYRELIGKVDAVSLAAPTVAHAEIACALLNAGIHLLVEKPIARTLDEADAMISAADRSGAVWQV